MNLRLPEIAGMRINGDFIHNQPEGARHTVKRGDVVRDPFSCQDFPEGGARAIFWGRNGKNRRI